MGMTAKIGSREILDREFVKVQTKGCSMSASPTWLRVPGARIRQAAVKSLTEEGRASGCHRRPSLLQLGGRADLSRSLFGREVPGVMPISMGFQPATFLRI
jgi:hypothetical protein